MIARIIDNTSGNWWCKNFGCTYLVLSIRQETVLVKSNADEYLKEHYNIHELPKEAVEIYETNILENHIINDNIKFKRCKNCERFKRNSSRSRFGTCEIVFIDNFIDPPDAISRIAHRQERSFPFGFSSQVFFGEEFCCIHWKNSVEIIK